MNVGVTGLVLPRDWSFHRTAEVIVAAGYDTLELVIRDSGYCSFESSDSQLADLRSQARDFRIDIASVCPGYRNSPRELISDDSGIRKASVEAFRSSIEITRKVGAKTLLVVLGQLTPTLYYDEAYEYGLKSMCELAPIAEDAGVNLSIEYVWNKFLLSPLEFARFCDDVASPNVGFYFDPGNMAIFGYPEHWVRICGRHLMAVHVKDFKRDGSIWTPLLEGDVDFPAVMRELRAIGFDGPLVSEVELTTASLEQTADAIRKISTFRG